MPIRRRSGGTQTPGPSTRSRRSRCVPASGPPEARHRAQERRLAAARTDRGARASRRAAARGRRPQGSDRAERLVACPRTRTPRRLRPATVMPAPRRAAAAPPTRATAPQAAAPTAPPARRSRRPPRPRLRREGLEAGRREDQRHRQLLRRREEHQRGAGDERGPQERQRDRSERPSGLRPRSRAESSRLGLTTEARPASVPSPGAGSARHRRGRAARASGTGTGRGCVARNTTARATTIPGSAYVVIDAASTVEARGQASGRRGSRPAPPGGGDDHGGTPGDQRVPAPPGTSRSGSPCATPGGAR